jgi:ATP synthase protein I
LKKSKSQDNPWKTAGLMGALGTNMVVCLLIGYFGGSYISERTGGHKGWVIAGVMTGLFVGIISIVLIIKRFMEDTDE